MPDKDSDFGRFSPAARPNLGEAFIKALADDFEKYGAAAIETVRAEKPDQYLKIVGTFAPKETSADADDVEALSDEELIERLRALHETVGSFLAGSEEPSLSRDGDKARAP